MVVWSLAADVKGENRNTELYQLEISLVLDAAEIMGNSKGKSWQSWGPMWVIDK